MILKLAGTVAALAGAWPYAREAFVAPQFLRLSYRALALVGIMAALGMILFAIWS